MLVGVPKEIKNNEFRVGITPSGVQELLQHGHQVLVQKNAGEAIGFTDELYVQAGACIVEEALDIFAKADMIVKVKEPQLHECAMLREGQLLFTYLHLAPDPEQATALIKSGCVAIAYETVTDDHGTLPLLTPMSEVAGRLSVQAGCRSLEKPQGGMGLLLGGVPGVAPAKVVVIGGGVVGTNAIRMAIGMEASVTVLDKSLSRLQALDLQFGAKIRTIFASLGNLESHIYNADLVIGAVLVAGDAAPKLIKRDMLKHMKPNSVIVDVAIDQGGCCETSKPTTHEDPTYVVDGVIHYCVANMPGAVPKTSSVALSNATLPFIVNLANKGGDKAMLDDRHLRNGLNVYRGQVTYEAVANVLRLPFVPALEVIGHVSHG